MRELEQKLDTFALAKAELHSEILQLTTENEDLRDTLEEAKAMDVKTEVTLMELFSKLKEVLHRHRK